MKTVNCVQWLWKLSKNYRYKVLINAIIGILRVCASLMFVWTTKKLVDIATSSNEQTFLPYILIMIGCMVLQLLFSVINTRLKARNTICMLNSIRHRLFTRLMESKFSGRERYHSGDIINRLEEDSNVITEAVCSIFPEIIITFIQLLAALCFLLFLEAKLAAVIVLIMPIALLLSKAYMMRMRKLTREIRDTDSKLQTHLQEHIQHRTLIRTLEQSDNSAETLATLQSSLQNKVMQRTDFSLFSRTAVQFGFAAGYAIAFLWGIFGLRSGAVTFGTMTAFLQLVLQVQRPIVELSKYIPSIIHSLTSVERLAELFDLPLEEQGEPIKLEGAIGIKLENVDYLYPDSNKLTINNFSHNFIPGSLTTLTGETGVGKSTLIRLILALLQPKNGQITLYNKEKEVNVSPQTRCNIIYVPQGNTLMSGTVRDNLLIGNPQATEDDLINALHTAAADFVLKLPSGLDTKCGEGGAGLSEGQAQRIAIARGLLRNGGILLLDEPTSALDENTTEILMSRLKNSTIGKTMIIITHSKNIGNLADATVKL